LQSVILAGPACMANIVYRGPGAHVCDVRRASACACMA
jgi:hypothetical protein